MLQSSISKGFVVTYKLKNILKNAEIEMKVHELKKKNKRKRIKRNTKFKSTTKSKKKPIKGNLIYCMRLGFHHVVSWSENLFH